MPFFAASGCGVVPNPHPPSGGNDASDCFGLLRTNIVEYIQTRYAQTGGVQNNSLGATPYAGSMNPVWAQTTRAAQRPPVGAGLFVGLQVDAPAGFYRMDATWTALQHDVQQAVDSAKQMLPGYLPVNFIEFYDTDIAGMSTLDKPPAVYNDDLGGYMRAPLTDAHNHLL